MQQIVGSRYPFKVVRAVVVLIKVLMVDLVFNRARTDKRIGHQAMDKTSGYVIIPIERHH
jgi:hypothetical protein